MDNARLNHDKQMDEILARGEYKILLHCCCAPCASACLERLSNQKVVAYYYNPNIMPSEEYQRRAEALKKLCKLKNVNIDICAYDNQEYLKVVKGLENLKEGDKRCTECFILRLSATAKQAKKLGMDYFATTLTLSPHKNSQLINQIGLEIEKKENIRYLPSDFKKKEGYKKSIELSRQFDLYRQDYCGCKF